MKTGRRLIATGVCVAITSLFSPNITPAHATGVIATYTQYNSSKSCTGAIYHRVRNSVALNPAYISEPGEKDVLRFAVSQWAHAKTFGVKVWQPEGTRLKTYERILGIWWRTHYYRPQDHGRDVWVTRGMGNAGGKDLTKITGC